MLCPRLLSRALTLPLIARTYTTMATPVPPQNFTLDRNIFNDTLYTNIRSFWFAGIPAGSKHGNAESLKRWWGIGGRTEEESSAYDAECRRNFGSILERIGPEHIALPPFKSYADELEHAQQLSARFISEIQGKDNGHERLLSLILLLDQLPRNIYRDPPGLRLVYNHYDRLAWSLIRSAPAANLIPHPSHRGNELVKRWLALPLAHSEDLESQRMALDIVEGTLREAREDGDEETAKEVELGMPAARKHLEIVERFGRFPHRNECLGRSDTGEEEEWLKDGETFGVKQRGKEGEGKDEL